MAEMISRSEKSYGFNRDLSVKIAKLALDSTLLETPDFHKSNLIPREVRQDTPLSLLGFEFLRLVHIVTLEEKEPTIAHLDTHLSTYYSVPKEQRDLPLEELQTANFHSYFNKLNEIIEDYDPLTLTDKFQELQSFMAHVVMSDYESISYLPPAS